LLPARENITLIAMMNPQTIIIGIVWYIVFLFSTVCHEGAHALVAMWGGDLTAFHGGQVSLNPIPHIRRSPWGMIVVPILSYALVGWMVGWASAPYDPDWQRRYPRRAAWMALAGPSANLILLLLAATAIRSLMHFGVLRAPGEVDFSHLTELANGTTNLGTAFLSILFSLNLLLFTFNLFPAPPLDGNTGITIFMKESTALRFVDWCRTSGYGFIGLLAAWYLFGRIFEPIFFFSLRALYPGVGYSFGT
jgi:Zn-dependent protease